MNRNHFRRSSLYFLEFRGLNKDEIVEIRARIANRKDVVLSGVGGKEDLARFHYRASDDEQAVLVARALTAGKMASLYTGLGIHRRLVENI